MRVDIRQLTPDEALNYPYRAWNRRTGKKIEWCYLADEERGYAEAYQVNEKGQVKTRQNMEWAGKDDLPYFLLYEEIHDPIVLLPKDETL